MADVSDVEDLLRRMHLTLEARQALAEAEAGAEGLCTLLDRELDLLRRAAGLRVETLPAIIGKLAIWELAAEDHDEGATLENAIVRSVLADLRRLERRPR